MRYSTVHTGPKSQAGGFHDGLFSVAYQSPGGKNIPIADAPKLRTIQPIRTNMFFFETTLGL